VKFAVVSSSRHKGKTLEVDAAKETITLVGLNGETMGGLTWDFLVDQILTFRKSQQPREARCEPRISLSIRVKYTTAEGTQFESRAGGIGGGGLFIESFAPLAVGTKLTLAFTLPESPDEWLSAKGGIAWVCPKADQYTFSPGMGVRFTEIAVETRNRVLSLVHSVKYIPQNDPLHPAKLEPIE
jgi:type IV pilus assembly protein PilZ